VAWNGLPHCRFRGVYRVGHKARRPWKRDMAEKAGGKGAALSGRAAGHLFGLIKGTAPPPEMPRTLVDLSSLLSLDEQARAFHEA
jgi:hypothetical protein